jgi:hypothetical protein
MGVRRRVFKMGEGRGAGKEMISAAEVKGQGRRARECMSDALMRGGY